MLKTPLDQQIERRTDGLRFVFTRPQGSSIQPWVQPQFSDKLDTWEAPDSIRMTERILSVKDGVETIEVTLPILPASKGFMRLKMEEPPAVE